MNSATRIRLRHRVWRHKHDGRSHVPCFWCGSYLHHTLLTLEHIIPQSLGGNNRLINLELSCADCNHKRGNTISDDELIALGEDLIEEMTERKQDFRNVKMWRNGQPSAIPREV